MEKFISIKNWLSESFLTVDGKKLPVIFVKKEDWPEGKNDPTEYSTDENAVRIRKGDYDTEKDPMGWLRHELMHYLLDQKGFKERHRFNSGRPCPDTSGHHEPGDQCRSIHEG